VKQSYRSGHVRVHRPRTTEPGMGSQYDYGDGPVVEGVKTPVAARECGPGIGCHTSSFGDQAAYTLLTCPACSR